MFKCNDTVAMAACEYCGEIIMKLFMSDHWAECIDRVYHFIEQRKKGLTMNSTYPGKLECAICLIDICRDHPRTVLNCAHIFHKSCIGGWLAKKQCCPVCQTD